MTSRTADVVALGGVVAVSTKVTTKPETDLFSLAPEVLSVQSMHPPFQGMENS